MAGVHSAALRNEGICSQRWCAAMDRAWEGARRKCGGKKVMKRSAKCAISCWSRSAYREILPLASYCLECGFGRVRKGPLLATL